MSAGEHARGLVGSRQKGFPEFRLGTEHRLKIANSNILSYLIETAEGRREMTPVQAQVSIALMKKVLPDLAAVEHTGDVSLVVEAITRTIVRPTLVIDASDDRAA